MMKTWVIGARANCNAAPTPQSWDAWCLPHPQFCRSLRMPPGSGTVRHCLASMSMSFQCYFIQRFKILFRIIFWDLCLTIKLKLRYDVITYWNAVGLFVIFWNLNGGLSEASQFSDQKVNTKQSKHGSIHPLDTIDPKQLLFLNFILGQPFYAGLTSALRQTEPYFVSVSHTVILH